MRRRGNTGKRLGLILGLVGATALFGAGIALAATDTIVGQGTNTFSQPTYNTDQGQIVPFQVTGSSHNVTATATGPDGKALFRSATISGGTTQVNGTQYLTSGDYTFFCTIHGPSMSATLHVTDNGTPQARPHAALSVLSKKISKVARKGKLLVGVNVSTAVDGASLLAKLGKTTIGSAGGLSLAAGQQSEVIKLTKAGKNKLRGKAKASVTVTADLPFGSPASARGKLK